MSTRSYVGIIKNGKVKYGYHHSDSYIEDLGIELFKNIADFSDVTKLKDYAEIDSLENAYQTSYEDFFTTPVRNICIEFCYGFNVDDNTWYVSSLHFTDKGKIHKLTDVVKDDKEMEKYLSMYYEEYREPILKEIRANIK